MTTDTSPEIERDTNRPPRRISAAALLTGVLLGGLLAGGAFLLIRTGTLASSLFGRSTRIDTSTPAVLDRIRQLSRLESVEYSLDKIVEGERGTPYIPDFLMGEKLLLIAHGEVTAGVDLAQLKPGDVAVQGDAVRVHLPAPQVFSTRLDNARTRVYSRTTGLLVTADPNLETQIRQEAEAQIAQAALADGILDKAKQNARASLTAFLGGLGFRQVSVD